MEAEVINHWVTTILSGGPESDRNGKINST